MTLKGGRKDLKMSTQRERHTPIGRSIRDEGCGARRFCDREMVTDHEHKP